jgi:hypothetical protein
LKPGTYLTLEEVGVLIAGPNYLPWADTRGRLSRFDISYNYIIDPERGWAINRKLLTLSESVGGSAREKLEEV